jgi:ribonuclease HI
MFLNLWGHQKIVVDHPIQKDKEGMATAPQLWTYQKSDHATTSSSLQKKTTNHACDGYRGVYHIEKGDAGGAAGTVFFQFVIGQLIWAEMNNFKPWVYLNNVSYVIYDPIVHGRGPGVDFTMMGGLNISYIERPNGHWRDSIPGTPQNWEGLVPTNFHFDGDGVWDDYFESVSDFVPGDASCRDKPLVTMSLYQVTPGVHGFAPWAPRCWRYEYLPDYVTKPHVPLNEWLEPQRHVAHKTLTKYIKFLPHIQEKADLVNPDCSLEHSCLGIHIRQSDKAAGRRQIQTDEFLPYVEAFVQGGGEWIYLATDSGKVMEHIKKEWPKYLQKKIRSMGDNVVRSNDNQAVFDIASHHRTNTEILIEILALSNSQFMIHGLSAVTETSIWINVDLHYTSVDLEDPDHLGPKDFSSLVQKVLVGGNASQIVLEQQTTDWWKTEIPSSSSPKSTHEACDGVDGILHISHVGAKAGAGTAFFISVLNQLYYAERYNLKPWIHLSNESDYIYDEDVHGVGPEISIERMTGGLEVSTSRNKHNATFFYPGNPLPKSSLSVKSLHLPGNGVWGNYFEPVSDFVPGDNSCRDKPFVALETEMVMPGLYSWCPWSIRAWRNDDVPDDIWKPDNMTLKSWVEPMRRKAHELVKKYYKFHPFIEERAREVNPANATSPPCLAIHLRNSDKKGKFRSKFTVNKFRDYINAFMRAGGKTIYVATDSHRVLEYIEGKYPAQVRQAIRTQGPYVVRSTSKWPIHFLEKHHRTNSEALVDILAMSKCQLLLHGDSAVSEAAIYLNIDLHNKSVNWEDPDRMNVDEFETLAKEVLGTTKMAPVQLNPAKGQEDHKGANQPKAAEQAANVTIVKGSNDRKCKKNAIVYLAQKRHSTYDRDSYGILLESLDLINKNYLSLNHHHENTDVMIFHTADFDHKDLDTFESQYGADFRNSMQLIDLSGTQYWRRPSWHEGDDPMKWYAYPLFSEGYRRMMHWFAIDIWQFFLDHGRETGCNYEYIMRFDEDSFLHSPIQYDIFDFMKQNDYYYGFRLCAYEMQVTQRIWKLWRTPKNSPKPIRDIELGMCGVYNNFFVAKLSFFQSPAVKKFLHFVDRQGMIYRRRLGDLMIHSMTIYSFAPPEKIHRFLDFTYEHSTVEKKSGCVVWGGIQAGYDDPNSDFTIDNYYQKKVFQKGCQANLTLMRQRSLSPTYSHLPDRLNGKVALKSVMAGNVELPGRGILSG